MFLCEFRRRAAVSGPPGGGGKGDEGLRPDADPLVGRNGDGLVKVPEEQKKKRTQGIVM